MEEAGFQPFFLVSGRKHGADCTESVRPYCHERLRVLFSGSSRILSHTKLPFYLLHLPLIPNSFLLLTFPLHSILYCSWLLLLLGLALVGCIAALPNSHRELPK
jgi:hypothetical protein